MSGIEVAGLVLGALPLLLSGLEYYKEGMIPLKDFVRFEMVIRELRRRLQNAHMRFKNTCEKLLNGLLSQDDESLLLLLLRNPGGPEWQTPEMMQKIRLRLQKSYETFLDTVVYIGCQLDELRTVIGLDDKGYPSWINSKDSKHRRLWRRSGASTWKRITISLGHNEHERHLDRIEKCNRDLEIMTQDSIDLEPLRLKRSWLKDSSVWQNRRESLRGLFQVLKKGWPSDCPHAHKASLRLENCSARREGGKEQPIKVVFESSHPLPWVWREAEINPHRAARIEAREGGSFPANLEATVRFQLDTPALSVQPPVQASTAAEIENLCAAINELKVSPACVGYLNDGNFHHHFYSPTNPSMSHSPSKPLTLQQILSNHSDMEVPDLSTKDKYELALVLASAVFQLCSTPWLREDWRRSDIHFIHDVGAGLLARRTYVCHTFDTDDGRTSILGNFGPDSTCPAIRNSSIFRLGVLLLELSFGKTLEQYEQESDFEDGRRISYTEVSVARRLALELENREGDRYANVVNRCINCIFEGLNPSLENDKFRLAFYQGVVEPLQGIVDNINQ